MGARARKKKKGNAPFPHLLPSVLPALCSTPDLAEQKGGGAPAPASAPATAGAALVRPVLALEVTPLALPLGSPTAGEGEG